MRGNHILVRLFVAMALICIRCDAAPPPDPAVEMQKSGITLTDGSSFYTFAKDGTFRSGPVGISGRTFEGHWKLGEHYAGSAAKVIVEAKFGWDNGLSPRNDYRRIVFAIYSGTTIRYEPDKDVNGKPLHRGMMPESYYKCYWIIDEFTKISKPSN